VGDGLDAEVVTRWATAFGTYLAAGPVVVGRDSRPSGSMVLPAVAASLMSTGHDVWDIGVATTPTTAMAVSESEAVGGVIITASHNPQPWNALKFLDAGGLFLTAEANQHLQEKLDSGEGHVTAAELGSWQSRQDADRNHLDAILKLPWLDRQQIAARNLHVVVDAVEGAGGRIVPALLSALGVRCTPLYCGMSGHFPHDPEPTPAHLTQLCHTVREQGADLGCAVDPDSDRLALVDGTGQPLSEELTLVLAVDFLLGHQAGPVVVNLSTTSLVEKVAAGHGVPVERTPVGEANVVQTMRAKGAVIGGEGNGGVIYPALHAGRDALVGIAMILQSLTEKDSTLAQLVSALPPAAMVKEKVASDTVPLGDNLAAIMRGWESGTIDTRDGVRWSSADGWVHVRPSNTEPVVRIIAEARSDAAARSLIERVKSAS